MSMMMNHTDKEALERLLAWLDRGLDKEISMLSCVAPEDYNAQDTLCGLIASLMNDVEFEISLREPPTPM
jgi:hypothetical protein